MTEWHRELFGSPTIGGDDPGSYFDEHLDRVGAEHIWIAEAHGRPIGMTGLIPSDVESELEPIVVARDWRGRGVGAALAGFVIEAARTRGNRRIVTKPVARNEAAIRFFHGLGFDVLSQLELIADLTPPEEQVWRAGAELADRSFRV